MIKNIFQKGKSIFCLLGLTLSLLISFNSLASTTNNKLAKEKISIDGKHDAETRKNRINILNLIESELNALNSKIPNLTPEELKWIETEKNAIDQITQEATSKNQYDQLNKREGSLYNRKGQLYTSIAYNKQEVKILLNTGLSLVEKIRQAARKDEEMIYWTQLAAVIIDRATLNESLDALKTTIKDPEYFRLYYDAAFLDGNGREILSGIIIPYIQEESIH